MVVPRRFLRNRFRKIRTMCARPRKHLKSHKKLQTGTVVPGVFDVFREFSGN